MSVTKIETYARITVPAALLVFDILSLFSILPVKLRAVFHLLQFLNYSGTEKKISLLADQEPVDVSQSFDFVDLDGDGDDEMTRQNSESGVSMSSVILDTGLDSPDDFVVQPSSFKSIE